MVGKVYGTVPGKMNKTAFEAASKLVSTTYVKQAEDAKRTHEKYIQILMQQVNRLTNATLCINL